MTEVGIPFLEGKYSPTLDIWPIECKEFNRNYIFYDNLKQGRFTTTKCKKCQHVAYPPRIICPKCYSDELEYIDLPKKGTVITFVEKVAGVPICFTPPVIDAWIDMGKDSPVKRLLSRVINCAPGQLKEGDELQLVVFPVPSHPVEWGKEKKIVDRVYFAFEPAKQG
jgi:uncharacterized OB-fold protein